MTILVWGLILEILVVIHYASRGELQKFEFQYTLVLLVITAAATAVVLRRIAREVRG